MNDYISRDAAIEKAEYDGNYRLVVPIEAIKVLPAADVVPEQYWIPCSERLPEICAINGALVNYLIYCPDFFGRGPGVDIGNYVPDAGKWFCLGIPCRVTHWASLPEPPEKGESDHG